MRDDRRIGGEDDFAGIPARGDRPRLVAGDAEHVGLGRLAGKASLVDIGGINGKIKTRGRQQLRAPRRGGRQDQRRGHARHSTACRISGEAESSSGPTEPSTAGSALAEVSRNQARSTQWKSVYWRERPTRSSTTYARP